MYDKKMFEALVRGALVTWEWECFLVLRDFMEEHGLRDVPWPLGRTRVFTWCKGPREEALVLRPGTRDRVLLQEDTLVFEDHGEGDTVKWLVVELSLGRFDLHYGHNDQTLEDVSPVRADYEGVVALFEECKADPEDPETWAMFRTVLHVTPEENVTRLQEAIMRSYEEWYEGALEALCLCEEEKEREAWQEAMKKRCVDANLDMRLVAQARW